jgi:hypothetical protein
MDVHIATMHMRVEMIIHNAEILAEALFRYNPSSAHARSYGNSTRSCVTRTSD